MEQLNLARGARKIVRMCAGLRAGEQALVVTDFHTTAVAEAVARACLEADAEVVLSVMAPRELDGEEPPRVVAQAMQAADVIFTPVKRSVTHSSAMKQALGSGARTVSLSAFVPEMLISGGIDADFTKLKPRADLVAAAFSRANSARLLTPGGTDLAVDITGRPGNGHGGLAHNPGELATIPNVESSVSPLEGSAEGRLVIDASIPYLDLGVVSQPIYMEVSGGKVLGISSEDPLGDRLSRILAAQAMPDVYNIAQLAVGLNPHCRIRGWMMEDEGVYGTAHIGIGTSAILGGEVQASLHFDAVMWRPTLYLDNEKVMEDGVWLDWAGLESG